MSKQKLNPGHWLEATDRTHCVIEMIQIMLLDHPAISQTRDIKVKVEAAQNILGEVYQECGAKM